MTSYKPDDFVFARFINLKSHGCRFSPESLSQNLMSNKTQSAGNIHTPSWDNVPPRLSSLKQVAESQEGVWASLSECTQIHWRVGREGQGFSSNAVCTHSTPAFPHSPPFSLIPSIFPSQIKLWQRSRFQFNHFRPATTVTLLRIMSW